MLLVEDGELSLVVADDGVGMAPGAPRSGLENAQLRAVALGGRLELSAVEPHGLRFCWRVPLSRAEPRP
jgi:signal transduction histidine kinase